MRRPWVRLGVLSSAFTCVWALFEVSLAAVPLLILAQCLGLGDVHATMRAANHGRGGVLGCARAFGLADEAAPDPDRGKDDGDPEQQAEKTHIVLFCLLKVGSLAKPSASAQCSEGSV